MEVETKRLKLIACDSYALKLILAQNYENGPQITNHTEELTKDPSVYGWGTWLILRKSDELIIGDGGFKGKPDSNKEVEVGYGLLESAWGLGYATEAVQGLLDWAFNTKAVDKIVAETELDNIGSIRVLEKVGMKKTGNKEGMIYWELEELER